MQHSKNGILGFVLLLLPAGCATVERVSTAPATASRADGREFVDRLSLDTEWHPAPTGGECFNCWYELPPGAYIAQG
jgi:hypothetical protein